MQVKEKTLLYPHRRNRLFIRFVIICSSLIFLLNGNQSIFAQQDFGFKDIPLSWRNFSKRDISSKSNAAASTAVNLSIVSEVEGDDLKITLELEQSRSRSWVSRQFLRRASDRESMDLLNHERLHYAINLIGLKSIYDELNSSSFTADYKSEVAAIFHKHNQQTSKTNGDYDRLTLHGTIPEQQKKWEQNIFMELNNLYREDEKIETYYIIRKKLQIP